MAVDALEKPAFTKCQHVCSRGCRVYESRPGACKTWFCAWALGHLPHDWRPDKIGVVGDIGKTGTEWSFAASRGDPAIFDDVKISTTLKGLTRTTLQIIAGGKKGITHVYKGGFCRRLNLDETTRVNAGEILTVDMK